MREIVLYLKRVLKRLDVSSRSLMTLIEPGSCFTGILYVVLTLYDWLYRLVI